MFTFRADSITFNPHKMLTAPQQCSVLLTKHKDILNSCHSCSAQYLFQKDKFYDTQYDTGDKHIQCGRRADVLKFWLMWKAKVSEVATGYTRGLSRASVGEKDSKSCVFVRMEKKNSKSQKLSFYYNSPSRSAFKMHSH